MTSYTVAVARAAWRSATFNANWTPCPHCGSTERQTQGTVCGCNLTEHVEVEKPPFQDDAQKTVVSASGHPSRFHLETRVDPPSRPTAEHWIQVRACVSSPPAAVERWTHKRG